MRPRARALFALIPLIGLALMLLGGQSGRVTTMPIQYEIAAGYLAGYDTVHKFGFHTDIDNTEETVHEAANFPALTQGPPRIILDTTGFTLFISSDNGADTEDIRVMGLDASWDAVTVDVTLAGLTYTQVGTSSNWLRVNRAFNIGTNDLQGVIYLHDDAVDGGADGIPDIPATQIRAVINAGENQTLQGAYTIPDGFMGLLTEWCSSALSTSGTTNPITTRLRLTQQGGVSRIQERFGVGNPDSFCHTNDPPEAYSARDALEITAISTGAASNVDTSATFHLVLIPE